MARGVAQIEFISRRKPTLDTPLTEEQRKQFRNPPPRPGEVFSLGASPQFGWTRIDGVKEILARYSYEELVLLERAGKVRNLYVDERGRVTSLECRVAGIASPPANMPEIDVD